MGAGSERVRRRQEVRLRVRVAAYLYRLAGGRHESPLIGVKASRVKRKHTTLSFATELRISVESSVRTHSWRLFDLVQSISSSWVVSESLGILIICFDCPPYRI